MSRSRDQTQGKCFSGILSRFLCIRSLPTHPTESPGNDHFTTKAKHQSFKDLISKLDEGVSSKPGNEQQQDVAKATTKPGVVARLMGLETLPLKDGNHGSYLRSRSVNFVDYLYSCDDITTSKPQHRRVLTSLSYREVPASFENRSAVKKEKGDQISNKPRLNDYRQVKQKKMDQREGDAKNGGKFVKKKHIRVSEEPRREISTGSSSKIEASRKIIDPERTKRGSREVHVGLNNKLKNKKKKKKKRKANWRNPDEFYPESTSSNSDSCLQDSSLHVKVNKSGNQDRTSLMKHVPKHNYFDGSFDEEEFCLFSGRDLENKAKIDLQNGLFMNMLAEVRNKAEDEITRTSWNIVEFEDLEEISVYVGDDILESLLNYLTDELLVEFSRRVRNNCNLDSRIGRSHLHD